MDKVDCELKMVDVNTLLSKKNFPLWKSISPIAKNFIFVIFLVHVVLSVTCIFVYLAVCIVVWKCIFILLWFGFQNSHTMVHMIVVLFKYIVYNLLTLFFYFNNVLISFPSTVYVGVHNTVRTQQTFVFYVNDETKRVIVMDISLMRALHFSSAQHFLM